MRDLCVRNVQQITTRMRREDKLAPNAQTAQTPYLLQEAPNWPTVWVSKLDAIMGEHCPISKPDPMSRLDPMSRPSI